MTVGYMTKPAGAKVADCTYTGSRIDGSATVIDAGNSFRSDGLGDYIAGKASAQVYAQAAWNIFPFRSSTGTALRHLIVDLNHPVPNGGGVPRGIVSSRAGPHSYWHLDEKNHVYGVLDIPEGTTTNSDLTAIGISPDDGGSTYILQMGSWAWDTCENSGPMETKGSTRAVITRTGAKTWTVSAPAGSIGVLHDVHDPGKPVPLGLYFISFEIHYTLQ
jgi:hypothetical protein